MVTGKLTSYDLTTGVIVDMDEAIYMVSPTDSPFLAGTGADGLSVLASRPATQKKLEWQDEELLLPSSTIGVTFTTGDTALRVASAAHRERFSTGDILMLGPHLEWVRVTGYSVTSTDYLVVARAYGGVDSQHTSGGKIVSVGLALAEGSDPENARAVDRSARFNYTQIFGPTKVEMSRTDAKIGRYGVSDEFNHQLMARITENVISREQAILYGTRLDDTTNKRRTMGGLFYYINAQGTVDSSTTALTVGAIQTMQQTLYNAGGVPDRAAANPAQIKNLTDVATLTTINEGRDETGRGRQAAVYVDTEFGRLTLVRNRYVLTTDLFLFVRDQVVRRIFDTLQFEWLAKTGDSKKGQIVCEESLEVKGPQHMGIFTALA